MYKKSLQSSLLAYRAVLRVAFCVQRRYLKSWPTILLGFQERGRIPVFCQQNIQFMYLRNYDSGLGLLALCREQVCLVVMCEFISICGGKGLERVLSGNELLCVCVCVVGYIRTDFRQMLLWLVLRNGFTHNISLLNRRRAGRNCLMYHF